MLHHWEGVITPPQLLSHCGKMAAPGYYTIIPSSPIASTHQSNIITKINKIFYQQGVGAGSRGQRAKGRVGSLSLSPVTVSNFF